MIAEDQLEQLSIEWFQTTGWDYVCGYDIVPGECSDYRQIILHDRLLGRLQVINPHISVATLEQMVKHIAHIKSQTFVVI